MSIGRFVAALVIGCVLAGGQALGQPTVVAKVKVQNPSTEGMTGVVVRGTLPLPADFAQPIGVLALRAGGKVLPTQVAVLSTYAGADEKFPVGRPEVVQLAARADLAANGFTQLDVVQLPAAAQTAGACEPGAAVGKWLAAAAPVLVEATDCYGNVYRASPLEAKCLIETRQGGPLLSEKVFQAILTPVGQVEEAKPAIKQFLRVRAYLTQYASEDFASLALMIHNGSIDHPNGDVYYGTIRVGVPESMGLHVWHKEYSPAVGDEQAVEGGYVWQPCPAADKDGKVFVMPNRQAAVLRTFVHAPAVKARAVLFAENAPIFVPVPSQEQWSWSNFATARYGANKCPMPLAMGPDEMAKAEKEYANWMRKPWSLRYRDKLPEKPVKLGHAMPAYDFYGGATGGVDAVYGALAAVTGHNGSIHWNVIHADRMWDRQPAHRFYDDGRPFTFGRHVTEKGGRKFLTIPHNNSGFPIERIDDPACKVQADHVKANNLLSPAAKGLLRYMAIDDQHLIRLFDAVPAAYLACDPINRDRMISLGGQGCLKLNLYPLLDRPSSSGYSSLLQAVKRVDARPHQGIGWNRSTGWITKAIGCAYFLSQNPQIRADALDVAKAETHVLATAQMPAGNVTIRGPMGGAFKGGYFHTTSWEEGAIIADGAKVMLNMFDAPATAEQAEKLRQVYGRVGRWLATTVWNDQAHGPGFRIALRKKGESQLLEKPLLQGQANFYMGNPFTWYYELTGDPIFVERLKEMAQAAGKPSIQEAALHYLATYGIGNWTYCLWFTEGGRIPGCKPLADF